MPRTRTIRPYNVHYVNKTKYKSYKGRTYSVTTYKPKAAGLRSKVALSGYAGGNKRVRAISEGAYNTFGVKGNKGKLRGGVVTINGYNARITHVKPLRKATLSPAQRNQRRQAARRPRRR